MHTDHDAPNADVNPEAIKRGHEADTINLKAILYVPVALVIAFAMAYGIVTLIITGLRDAPKSKPANAMAAAQNDPSLTERMQRISSTDPNATIKQPRLEGLETYDKDNPLYSKPYVRSFEALDDKTNSKKLHPEDLLPTSKYAREQGSQTFKWVDEKKGIVQIPIEVALKLLADGSTKEGDATAKKIYDKEMKFVEKYKPANYRNNLPKASNLQWGMRAQEEHDHAEHGDKH